MSTGARQDLALRGECGCGDYRLKHPQWKRKPAAFQALPQWVCKDFMAVEFMQVEQLQRNTEKSPLLHNWWPHSRGQPGDRAQPQPASLRASIPINGLLGEKDTRGCVLHEVQTSPSIGLGPLGMATQGRPALPAVTWAHLLGQRNSQ